MRESRLLEEVQPIHHTHFRQIHGAFTSSCVGGALVCATILHDNGCRPLDRRLVFSSDPVHLRSKFSKTASREATA